MSSWFQVAHEMLLREIMEKNQEHFCWWERLITLKYRELQNITGTSEDLIPLNWKDCQHDCQRLMTDMAPPQQQEV